MDVFELAAKVGGEVVNNEARLRIDGDWVTLASDGVLTEEGTKMAEQLAAPKAATKKATKAKSDDSK